MSKNPVHDTYRQDLPETAAHADRHRPAPVRHRPARVRDGSGRRRAGPARPRDRRAGCPDRRTDPAGRFPPADGRSSDQRERRERPAGGLGRDRRAARPGLGRARRLAGQSRWIPFTTVRIEIDHDSGLGVRATALSGFWLGRIPVGLLDHFVVTGWTPPDGCRRAELEVLHLGPYFTGEGVFALRGPWSGSDHRTCVELFDLPAGAVTEPVGRLLLPVLRAGFAVSLRRFATVCESGRERGATRSRRPAALPLGALGAGVHRLPRPRMGPAGHQRRRPLRAAEPGGLPVGAVLDHHPAQARGVPVGLRRVRSGNRGPVRRGRCRAVDGRSGHRPQPGQDQRRDPQRPGRGRSGRQLPAADLGVRGDRATAADRRTRCAPPHRNRWRWLAT